MGWGGSKTNGLGKARSPLPVVARILVKRRSLHTPHRCASVIICEVAFLRASTPLTTPLSAPSRVPNRSHELAPEELSIYRQLDPEKIPQHVAIIMDGN